MVLEYTPCHRNMLNAYPPHPSSHFLLTLYFILSNKSIKCSRYLKVFNNPVMLIISQKQVILHDFLLVYGRIIKVLCPLYDSSVFTCFIFVSDQISPWGWIKCQHRNTVYSAQWGVKTAIRRG